MYTIWHYLKCRYLKIEANLYPKPKTFFLHILSSSHTSPLDVGGLTYFVSLFLYLACGLALYIAINALLCGGL